MTIDRARFARQFGASANPQPPRYLGSRYNADGQFLSDPGNTIVCHLKGGSETEAALLEARAAVMAFAEPGELAFTAPESLHMTLFQGILDRRRTAPYWPADMADDLSVDETTERFIERLDGFEPGPAFAVEVTEVLPLGLIVKGHSEADRQALQLWRDRLADRFGYRHPDHDSYEFHITFAYPIRWIADNRIDPWADRLDALTAELRARVPVLDLRAPAFCSFETLDWFEELMVLPISAEATTVSA